MVAFLELAVKQTWIDRIKNHNLCSRLGCVGDRLTLESNRQKNLILPEEGEIGNTKTENSYALGGGDLGGVKPMCKKILPFQQFEQSL